MVQFLCGLPLPLSFTLVCKQQTAKQILCKCHKLIGINIIQYCFHALGRRHTSLVDVRRVMSVVAYSSYTATKTHGLCAVRVSFLAELIYSITDIANGQQQRSKPRYLTQENDNWTCLEGTLINLNNNAVSQSIYRLGHFECFI